MKEVTLEIKQFQIPKNDYLLDIDVYFCSMENSCLISVPKWNCCYLWESVNSNDFDKRECINAFTVSFYKLDATNLVDKIQQYLLLSDIKR
ncbi:hypothetical protein VBD025_03910 [Virgibacillus flavescens]|uniref:hypothetical protein n=1 Tax=Virgibacillus flavescens TaxID=1611422 RepID=UPI003D336BA1